MAFSTSNIQSSYAPPLKIVIGDWSGSAGDAPGTLSIGGRYVGSLWFKNDSTTVNQNTNQVFPAVNWDGNVPGTLTIQNLDNVGTGSFIIFTRGA